MFSLLLFWNGFRPLSLFICSLILPLPHSSFPVILFGKNARFQPPLARYPLTLSPTPPPPQPPTTSSHHHQNPLKRIKSLLVPSQLIYPSMHPAQDLSLHSPSPQQPFKNELPYNIAALPSSHTNQIPSQPSSCSFSRLLASWLLPPPPGPPSTTYHSLPAADITLDPCRTDRLIHRQLGRGNSERLIG